MIASFTWLRGVFALLLSVLFSGVVYADTQGHTKNWNTAIITGPLSSDGRIKYYLQPQLNFIDDPYKFETAYLFAGAGFLATHDLFLWLMDGWFVEKRLSGKIRHLNVVRQQADWLPIQTPNYDIGFRTRIDERKDLEQPGWAVRIRERLRAVIPFKNWDSHSFVISEEVFFALTHPSWLNCNSFFEQNRAFVGVNTQLSRQTSFDLGYMNQWQVNNNHNQLSNILYLVFYFNLG